MKFWKFLLATTLCILILGCSESTSEKAVTNATGSPQSVVPIPQIGVQSGKSREDILFKGIPFDQPGQTAKVIDLCPKQSELGKCPTTKDSNKTDLEFYLPYGPWVQANARFKLSADGSLLSVKFVNSNPPILHVMESLTDKYGPAKIEKSQFQNRSGGQFESLTAEWLDSKGTKMTIKTNEVMFDWGSLTIVAPSVIAQEELSLLKAKQKNSNNL